ncbi:uncharacterized protein DS421_3g99760 [Arachis hypogaea]|nr:uncharacterized protein DS421_3g99760 [Arachis hypogaea]
MFVVKIWWLNPIFVVVYDTVKKLSAASPISVTVFIRYMHLLICCSSPHLHFFLCFSSRLVFSVSSLRRGENVIVMEEKKNKRFSDSGKKIDGSKVKRLN